MAGESLVCGRCMAGHMFTPMGCTYASLRTPIHTPTNVHTKASTNAQATSHELDSAPQAAAPKCVRMRLCERACVRASGRAGVHARSIDRWSHQRTVY